MPPNKGVDADEAWLAWSFAAQLCVLRTTEGADPGLVTMSSRLRFIAPDIEEALGQPHARTISRLAVRAALTAHPLGDLTIEEALRALESGDWSAAQARRPVVQMLAERLDAEYLVLYAAAGERNTPMVVEAFSRAGAADALLAALGEPETMAAKESLYEAHASLDPAGGEQLLEAVRSVLATA